MRYTLILALTFIVLISVAGVNLASSLDTNSRTKTIERIVVPTCTQIPHGEVCQDHVVPSLIAASTADELKRYKKLIEMRTDDLRRP